MPDKSCISIHLDSISGVKPEDFCDPIFFNIADRFFELSNKYGFKYTIFIIGRDLKNPKIAERVKEWSRQGHEIGNHSYSHKLNLDSLSYNELEMEVMKSHELITKACGKAPRGFIAPAWAASDNLVDILLKNGYLYDTSVFPSYFMWLISAKIKKSNFRNNGSKMTVFRRRDLVANLFASTKPYFSDGRSLVKRSADGLLIIPLPVTPILRIPCWHTMSFLLPRAIFNSVLNSCLTRKYFYYVLHPADLLDRDDILSGDRNIQNIDRLNFPLTKKMQMLHWSLEIIIKRSLKLVTFEQMAEEIISEKRSNNV